MPVLGNKVFLSAAMSEVIEEFRSSYAKIFLLADKLNELAYREIFETVVEKNSAQQLLVACLLNRALTTFQGVVILCERGMPSEATTLLRTLLEAMFRLVAIARDPEVARAYIFQDEVRRKKFINKFKLLSNSIKDAVGNPTLDSLLFTIQQNIDDHDICERKTQWFAEKADLSDFYHSAYSVFSDTVHINVNDLQNELDVNSEDDVTGFNCGPRKAGLDGILFTAIESLIFCLRGTFSILPISSQAALDTIHAEFTALHKEVFPETET